MHCVALADAQTIVTACDNQIERILGLREDAVRTCFPAYEVRYLQLFCFVYACIYVLLCVHQCIRYKMHGLHRGCIQQVSDVLVDKLAVTRGDEPVH